MASKVFDEILNTRIDGCSHFRWHEALWLPQWQMHALPSSVLIQKNIIETASKLQAIRDIIGSPVAVTSWYRPEEYNRAIGGAKLSYHIQGLAVDFVVKGYKPDAVRELLLEYLDKLDIRMEDLEGASWIHIDLGKPTKNGGRFFKP